jgi:hypothetical protein
MTAPMARPAVQPAAARVEITGVAVARTARVPVTTPRPASSAVTPADTLTPRPTLEDLFGVRRGEPAEDAP